MTGAPTRAWLLALLLATTAGAARAQTLGARCQDDADCEDGLFCLGAGAGDTVAPAGGLCTTTCSADSQDCVAFDPWAACVELPLGEGGSGFYCLQGCDPSSSDMCHGRGDVGCNASGPSGRVVTDMSCDVRSASASECAGAAPEGRRALCACELEPTDAGLPGAPPELIVQLTGKTLPCVAPGFCEYSTTVCMPRCATDEGCPEGLACNPATGLCDTRGRVGAPAGASCAAGCAGTCGDPFVPPDPNFEGFELRCSETCVIGQPCGPPSVDSGRCFSDVPVGTFFVGDDDAGYFSGVSSIGPTLGPGNLAQCEILCACQADCGALGDDWVCERMEERAYALRGYRGHCVQGGALDVVTEAECATASADCTPGTTRPCRGPDDCLGEAACLADGTYAPCGCGGASAGAASELDAGRKLDAALLDAGAMPTGASVRGGGCGIVPGRDRSPSPLALALIYGVLALPRGRRRSRPPRRRTCARP